MSHLLPNYDTLDVKNSFVYVENTGLYILLFINITIFSFTYVDFIFASFFLFFIVLITSSITSFIT
jgi:hypothetical protein